MTAYGIVQDGWKFKQFDIDHDLYIEVYEDSLPEDAPEDFGHSYKELLDFGLYNLSVAQWWEKVDGSFTASTRLKDKNIPIPDIALWTYGTLIFSALAKEKLEAHLNTSGELLPVDVNGQEYFIFNCLIFAEHDQIKASRDVERDGETLPNLGFNEVDIKRKPLFKTKAKTSGISVFCNEEFKIAVEENNLTGIKFNEDLHSIF